jgi:hypothetical protein
MAAPERSGLYSEFVSRLLKELVALTVGMRGWSETPPRTRDVVTWLSLGSSPVGANYVEGQHGLNNAQGPLTGIATFGDVRVPPER